ncbi:MAG: hypothetical protein Q4P78_06030 [Rothia sp. (in: high G+C Gram-positive bacteria)]|uniref:hypothetical protein n=1 Tax=Rothia sp. (in: high G+C Gram-positive bacteria) TaxID=1885016 RepID=UPI0026DFF671|nr:hypothetical protein [Rothia sp. (in: high G+C Gram-positive bacteria)]MDO5750747.1 hypothetical protein [Rothia sp. (in: high G+C Gram-positive bacteria)]
MNDTPRVSRRSLAKGAAWAAPAVVVSSAVPAHAASPNCEPVEERLFTEPNAWTITSEGKFVRAASNGPQTIGASQYYSSMTSAYGAPYGQGSAKITATAVYVANQGSGSSFDSRCGKDGNSMYQMSFNVSAVKSRVNGTGDPVHPKVTVKLHAPDGTVYDFYFSSQQGNGKYNYVEPSEAGTKIGTKYVTKRYNFKVIPGIYRFEVTIDIASSGETNSASVINKHPANGIGFTPPTFTPVWW